MNNLFIDCQIGLSGDMLLAAFLDLGVPEEVMALPLRDVGLENSYKIKINEDISFGLRGKKIEVISTEEIKKYRNWKSIRQIIIESSWKQSLKDKVYLVFESLAEAEASVHGSSVEDVHFHEIGAIDSLVDVISVCAAIEYLNPVEIVCSKPPAGSGKILTSHGYLPVPVPAVVELAKKYQIKLSNSELDPKQELTTPTGLALMAGLATKFGLTNCLYIESIGTGLGHRDLGSPNLLRIFNLKNQQEFLRNEIESKPFLLNNLVIHEAWVDDSSSEDISHFCNELRTAGAIEVVQQQIQMKKNRQGVLITSITLPENAHNLRIAWLSLGTSIGVRERIEGRWTLPRREGFCKTSLGPILVKQVKRPNGKLTLKPEHRDLLRLSKELGKSITEIRQEIHLSNSNFNPTQEWTF